METKVVLKSLKLSAFGTDCKYRIVETNAEIVSESDFHVKISRPVHPELEDLFTMKLPEIVAAMVTPTLADVPFEREKIIVTGVMFAGKDDNEGISIIGERESRCGKIAFKTPRIKYLLGDKEFHAQLTVIAAAIRREFEVYLRDETPEMEVFE